MPIAQFNRKRALHGACDARLRSNHDAVAVVYLVLDDLCREARVRLRMLRHLQVLKPDPYPAVPDSRALPLQRKAALARFVFPERADDFRIEHDRGHTAVVENDDALEHADHVRGHPDAFVGMGPERVEQVFRGGKVMRGGDIGWLSQQQFVFQNWANNSASLPSPEQCV